jgi:NhaP-type Na+/H+ or K+/H+ antiporter
MTELIKRVLSASSDTAHVDEHSDHHGVHHAEDEHSDHHGVGLSRRITFAFFMCMIFAQVIMHFTSLLGIPFTPMVFVASICFGTSRILPDEFLNNFLYSLDPDFLLLVFIPPLVYESASSVDYHKFMKQLGKILIMALPMVVASTYLTALVMYYVLGY